MILPAVQSPLSPPKPDGMREEGFAITNWPEIGGGWAARTNQVAREMQMKGYKAKQKGAPFYVRETREEAAND